MSIVISQNGETKLILKPNQFRRIHNLDDDGNLVYNHSACICLLENGAKVHIELLQALLEPGFYTVKALPSDLSFPLHLGEKEDIHWIKQLISYNFPDISVSDVYLNENISVLKS